MDFIFVKDQGEVDIFVGIEKDQYIVDGIPQHFYPATNSMDVVFNFDYLAQFNGFNILAVVSNSGPVGCMISVQATPSTFKSEIISNISLGRPTQNKFIYIITACVGGVVVVIFCCALMRCN